MAKLVINDDLIDGKILRAFFGTTKYCSFYLKGMECTNKECNECEKNYHWYIISKAYKEICTACSFAKSVSSKNLYKESNEITEGISNQNGIESHNDECEEHGNDCCFLVVHGYLLYVLPANIGKIAKIGYLA